MRTTSEAGAGPPAGARTAARRRTPAGSPASGLVGAALVLIGVGATLVALALDTPLRAQPLGGNTPVNAGAGDLREIDAHNSPTIVRNPADEANVVVANRIDSPRFGCGLHVSTDGGATFDEQALPIPPGEEPKCYAPDAAFGADGTLYVSYVTLRGEGNVPHAVWLATSADGGRTLSAPTRLLGELAFQTRLVADPRVPGRLHLTWVQAEEVAVFAFPGTGYPILSMTSDDGGGAWSDPVAVSDPARERVVAPAPAVDDEGRRYVAYLDLGEDRLDYHGGHEGRGGPPYAGTWELVVARSADGGASWTETRVDALTPSERFLVFLPPFPSVAVDGERLYVAFHDGRRGPGSDVWLWRSTDAGRSFASPVRVNDNPAGDGTRQHLPAVAVAPGGRVDVVYLDRRADPDDTLAEVSLHASGDRGRTFTPRLVLSDVAFDASIGFGSYRDMPELGSRLALWSGADRALAVWPDTRAGTHASSKQDLTAAVVTVAGGPTLPAASLTALRAGGAGLALSGLALLAAWAWRRRRA